ncbi:MAG TPA: ATP-binding protein [Mariprofundaceae bacterium]|nr:ATP-binding protein [Mariprofundaceae bacterium]
MKETEKQSYLRMQRLLYYRTAIAGFLLLIAGYVYFHEFPSMQQHILLAAALVYLCFIPFQQLFIRRIPSLDAGLGVQFVGDLLLVAALVFASGGVDSPFAFLFGLIIVAVGTQAAPLLTIAMTVLASVVYVCAVYIYAWYADSILSVASTLLILLQTSALFLVGGVMAALARRHERLQHESRQAISRHHNLQALHGQMMEVMHEGVLVLDRNLMVQDSNQAARRIFSTGESLQGRSLPNLMQVPARLADCFAGAVTTGCRCEWKDGERVFQISVVRLPRGGDNATWLMSIVDISEARALERKLAGQDKLASLGRMAAMLAHEIRNPLQTFSQAIELMPDSDRPREREMRAIMMEEVGRLNRLISSMLNYARPLQPKPQSIDVSTLFETTIRQVDMRDMHRIRWQCDCRYLRIDADHFRLLLDNLIRNAITASPEPESVQVKLYEEAATGCWYLEVSDEGGGIPDDVRKHLFEPFVTSRPAGFGLGLATAWQVCQANRWQIRCESTARGSRFVVSGRADERASQMLMQEAE